VSALARPQVGKYLNEHFVAAVQKVATFQINGGQKQGGNVAAYFCTADGHVLHAVPGPVSADIFLSEARWANETYQLALLGDTTPAQLQTFFRKAHLERLQQKRDLALSEDKLPVAGAVTTKLLDQVLVQNAHLGLDNQEQVHLLLAVAPLPRLDQMYQVVFERILNERISTNPVAVAGR
jgi:hypothetical protein